MTKFKFGDKVRVLPQKEKPTNWVEDMIDYQNKEGILVKENHPNYYVRFEDENQWVYKENQLELVNDKDIHRVRIPELLADWIDRIQSACNDVLRMSIKDAMDDLSLDMKDGHADEIRDWLFNDKKNWDVFAKAWLYGYEIVKEKKYIVKLVGTGQCLDKRYNDGYLFTDSEEPFLFTKDELKEAGFDGVFDNPMFEVEEVE